MAHTNESTPSFNALESTNNKWNPKPDFAENLRLLLRFLQAEDLFIFVIVQYNHPQIISEVKKELTKKYPRRPILSINSKNENYHSFTDKIYHAKGFVIVEDFLDMAVNPKIGYGFNQRRDRITQLPIQLLGFVPNEGGDSVRKLMGAIPDFWSVRNMTIELEVELNFNKNAIFESINILQNNSSDPNQSVKELERLKTEIKQLEENIDNYSLLENLYISAIHDAEQSKQFEEGLLLIDNLEKLNDKLNAPREKYSSIWMKKAMLLTELGLLEKAKATANDAISYLTPEQSHDKIYYNLILTSINILTKNTDEAYKLAQKALVDAKKISDQNGISLAHFNLGLINTLWRNYKDALLHFLSVPKSNDPDAKQIRKRTEDLVNEIKFQYTTEQFQLLISSLPPELLDKFGRENIYHQ